MTNPVTTLPSPAPISSVQGTLALDLQPALDPPRAGVTTLRRVPRPHSSDQVEAWTRRFVQAAVEIVGGDRPATQLLRHTTRDVYADLHRRALLVARAAEQPAGTGRISARRPKVASVHVSYVDPHTAECCARVVHGARSRALACRFERRGQHWVCTALEFA